MPVHRSRPSRIPQAVKGHRLLPTVLKQLLVGRRGRGRARPTGRRSRPILGTELNKALVAGKGGGAALDSAAKQSTAYLKRQGYYT